MISHFSQAIFEGTINIKDADLQKMAKVLNDVNIKECPYFVLSDKYGNSARYYRENQWIPVSERLPKEHVDVLCCFTSHGKTRIRVSHRMDYNYWNEVGRTGDMVAWMPLPEPYKEEKQ